MFMAGCGAGMWNLINRDWGPVIIPPIWIENVKGKPTLVP